MKVTKFRVPAEPPKGSVREAEYRRMDRKLSEEMAKKADELEQAAMEEELSVPDEDAQAMLERMLAMIHADPRLNAKAKESVEVPKGAEAVHSVSMADGTEAAVRASEDEAEQEELLRLGRALKASGKTLEDILGKDASDGPEASDETAGPDRKRTAPVSPSEKKPKRKAEWRWKRTARIFAGAAACLLVVFMVSMTSNAMRMFWIEKIEWLTGSKPRTTLNNEEHFSEEREYTETEALDLIKNTIGIRPVYFRNMPKEMSFSEVYVEEDAQWAKTFYDYEEKSVCVLMDRSDTEMSLGVVYDGEDLGTFCKDVNGVEVIIHKIQRDEEHIAYCAEMEYENTFYSVIGDMKEDVFLELMGNVMFW
ncbi:MAG: DUF4367 domain-containing protein [Oscillospiraceae bacterium]|nr:DUF4367 domain-containing protein [Oscillospiraceae bacterium]